MQCPVCDLAAAEPFTRVGERDYWHCRHCEAIFLEPAQRPDADTASAVYRLHRNETDDPAYRAFLARLATPMLEKLPTAARGLDYGCGPGPALAAMLTEAGHRMTLYDPLFFPDPAALAPHYDFITCTEVAEHFHAPAQEFCQFNRLLVPGGWLGVMTQFAPDDPEAFMRWHYHRDPTHVVFYRAKTFHVLAQQHGWHCEIPCANVALLRQCSPAAPM